MDLGQFLAQKSNSVTYFTVQHLDVTKIVF